MGRWSMNGGALPVTGVYMAVDRCAGELGWVYRPKRMGRDEGLGSRRVREGWR